MTMKCATLKPIGKTTYNFASNATMDMLNNLPFNLCDPLTGKPEKQVIYHDLKFSDYTHVKLYYRVNQYITLAV